MRSRTQAEVWSFDPLQHHKSDKGQRLCRLWPRSPEFLLHCGDFFASQNPKVHGSLSDGL
jgi:hypothetical protein